jgi:hypothetical protein
MPFIGTLTKVLTQITPLGVKLHRKNYYEIGHWWQKLAEPGRTWQKLAADLS